MSFAEDLISILGKDATSAEVVSVVNGYALLDSYNDPPFRHYLGSSQGGLKSQVQRLANPAAANSIAIASSGVFQLRV
jgi:hypothetical protein